MDNFQYLGFLIDDTARLYARRFREQSRQLSLEPSHCRALLVLAENAGISQTRLAEICGLNAAHMTRMVDLLEICGWVERHPHPHDRRTHLLSVTAKAVPVLRRVAGIIGEAHFQALQNFSAEEISTLLDLLERMRANLAASASAAASLISRHDGASRQALPNG